MGLFQHTNKKNDDRPTRCERDDKWTLGPGTYVKSWESVLPVSS